MNIIEYYNIPKERRPKAEFLGEIVEDLETVDFKTFKIVTSSADYQRDYCTHFQVAAPIVLDDMTEIKNEELMLEVTHALKVFKTDCTLDGKWEPAAVIDTGTSLIYIAQTDDGPMAFIERDAQNPTELS